MELTSILIPILSKFTQLNGDQHCQFTEAKSGLPFQLDTVLRGLAKNSPREFPSSTQASYNTRSNDILPKRRSADACVAAYIGGIK